MLWNLINSYRQAFRMYLRTKTKPRTIEEAEEKRLLWAKIYATVAFSLMSYCTYMTFKKGINFEYRKDIAKERAVAEALSSSAKRVVVYEGFTKVREIDLTQPEQEESKS